VVFFDKDQIREQVNSPTFYAGLWHRDGQDGVIDPARLCFGLRTVLLQLGVRIYEGTKLQNIEPIDKQGMLAICQGGSILSDKILMATNAYPNKISGIQRSIVPIWDYQIAIEPLTEEQCAAIAWPGSRHALSDLYWLC